MLVLFYLHVNYQGYQKAPSDKHSLPNQDQTQGCFESTTKLTTRAQWVLDAIAAKGTFMMGSISQAT